MKMDGAKSTTDTLDMQTKVCIVVDRRTEWAEVSVQALVDRSVMKIQVVVGA